MQKKLIALAVAGLASSAAFAQTNVTVYGIADGTFDYVWQSGSKSRSAAQLETTTALAVVPRLALLSLRSRTTISTSPAFPPNSSYLGFKGSEDLGNGLKAIFQYEIGLDFTTGSGTLAASRDSFVGLSHANAGTVVLGNLTGPTRALGAALDVYPGATGIGANSGLIGKIAGSTLKSSVTVTGATATGVHRRHHPWRTDSQRWATPAARAAPARRSSTPAGPTRSPTCRRTGAASRFAAASCRQREQDPGLRAPLRHRSNGVQSPRPRPTSNLAQRDTYGYDIGAKWEGMGFMAGLTYNWAQLGDFLDTEVDNLRVGGMYTGAWWSVRAMWEQTSADFNTQPFFRRHRSAEVRSGRHLRPSARPRCSPSGTAPTTLTISATARPTCTKSARCTTCPSARC